MKTAILIDGGFLRKRAHKIWDTADPVKFANTLEQYCKLHLKRNAPSSELYRIFYYDCPPISKKLFHPYLQKQIDLSKTEQYIWMNTFLDTLKHKRKFALRLGTLAETQAHYNVRYDTVKKLMNHSKTIADLTENDFEMILEQKGVDMKIGIDIASLAYKKQVEQIVLISGDSDFVPASKLARREGIDFILDPLWAPIKNDLYEHIDGIRSCCNNPNL